MPALKIEHLVKILIVDDDVTVQVAAVSMLEDEGFLTVLAKDGKECLELFEQHHLDFVLLDVNMAGMDGFEVCLRIREHVRGKHVPILMMTAMEDVASVTRAYQVGATDFVTKPINYVILARRVRYMLRNNSVIMRLHQSQAQLANVQRIARLGLWSWDLENNQLNVSDEVLKIYDLRAGDFRGDYQQLVQYVHEDEKAWVSKKFNKAIEKRQAFSIEHRIITPSGIERVVHQEAEIQVSELDERVYLIGTTQDVTDRKAAEDRILHLAYYDSLTNLPNRTFLKEHLSYVIEYAKRNNRLIAVLSLDLDNFGRINDSLGYSIGDTLLVECGQRLTHALRQSDCISRMAAPNRVGDSPGRQVDAIARVDGDNFVVLLADVKRPEDAASVVARISSLLSQPFEINEHVLVLTATIGIALYPVNGGTFDELLANADAALNHAKLKSRNCFQFYSEEINEIARRRLALETDLRTALENNEFELYYQPKVDVLSGKVSGMEALIRWWHPIRGMVMPLEFIPLAEETGLIVPLGAWVVRAACLQAKIWQQAGHQLEVSVNVSAKQFSDTKLVQTITSILAEVGLEPSLLEIEITEGVLMDDTERACSILNSLRALGVKISLDDFGTGYSSLSYLRHLPLDTLKIDRSFLMDLMEEQSSKNIVSAIIALSMGLNLKIVAEGVEEYEQLQWLIMKGCHQIQGYYFSPPLPALKFIEWLENTNCLQKIKRDD